MKTKIMQHFAGNFEPFYSKYLPDLKRGKANCPFHDCDSQSLSINAETGLFNCHFPGCAASGDIFNFYARKHGINGDFPGVLRGIAADFGISANGTKPRKLVKQYAYRDAAGEILFYKNRYEPKSFDISNPAGGGMGRAAPVLYNLPRIIDAAEVWLVEGEKDADALNALGLAATTNFDGAGKWKPSYTETLRGKRVFIIPDNDEAGRKHAQQAAGELHGKALSVKVIEPPGLPERGDVSDYIALVGDPDAAAERLSMMAEGAAEWTPAGSENPWTRAVIDFETLRYVKLPERRTFLFPWLTEQSMTLVYSWRGTGKSFFTLGIINAVTRGENFGPWEAVEPVPCLYLDGEMPAGMLQERAEEMGIGGPGTKAPARLISMNYALDLGLPRKNLLDPEWRGQLLEILVSGGYKLFFIDNISSLTPGIEENDKQAWDVLNQWLLELRFRGISSVSLHHAGKSGAQRGTSGREDNVDNSIVLKRPADYEITDGCRFICTFEKDRCTDARHLLMDYEFQYQNGLWTFANSKAKGREKVLRLLNHGMSQKQVADELSKDKGWVSRVRKEAVNAGWLTDENKLTQSGFLALLGEQPKSTGKSTS